MERLSSESSVHSAPPTTHSQATNSPSSTTASLVANQSFATFSLNNAKQTRSSLWRKCVGPEKWLSPQVSSHLQSASIKLKQKEDGNKA